jgi:hypothetical protein
MNHVVIATHNSHMPGWIIRAYENSVSWLGIRNRSPTRQCRTQFAGVTSPLWNRIAQAALYLHKQPDAIVGIRASRAVNERFP